jgi:hypothetical protein
MTPFFSEDIPAVIRVLQSGIHENNSRLIGMRDRQRHRENRLERLFSQSNSEEQIDLLLQQNYDAARQIRTMEESIRQKETRIRELNLKYQVALCREEHQRRYGW